jgi:lysophospholipase L1-like esterase
VDASGKDFTGKGSLYIKSTRAVNKTHLVANPSNITININSITASDATDNRGIYMTQTPAKVILNGGIASGYMSLKADYKSTVEVNGTRLKSAYDSVFANSSYIKCNSCILEPAKGQYMYSSIGSGAEIYFNNSYTTSKEKTSVSSGKVYGELTLLSEKCTPNAVSGCKVCNSSGTAWVDTDSKCKTGQICSAGVCVTKKYRIACFGDSITYANTYCAKLKTLGNYETFNHGVSGNTTVKLLVRMNDVVGKSYQYTTLLIGTNDLNTANKITAANYYDNLTDIVKQLKSDDQKVIISTIPPCNNWANLSCKVGNQIGPIAINKIIRRVSYDNNLCYADIFSQVFGSDYKSSQFKDALHPNDSAHNMMAGVFNDSIKSCKPFDCENNPNDCYLMQACTSNAVSGCKVCNSSGTAWVDTDSKCAASQKCSNGACIVKCTSFCEKKATRCSDFSYQICEDVNNDGCYEWSVATPCDIGKTCSEGKCKTICTPKTCATLGDYQCGSWSDGCGATINCGACAAGKTCSSGKCASNCTARSAKKCDSGNLYWYNSCNTKEELAENCGSDEVVDNYQCSGNWIQKETIQKGCFDAACTRKSVWINDTDCTKESKICSAGICKTESPGGGGSSSGGGPSGENSSSSVLSEPVSQLTRAEILQKINEIIALIAELQKQLNAILGKTATYSCVQITQNLYYGKQNDAAQVKCLQEILLSQGYEITVSGTYDLSTKATVKQFQEKYAGEILTPYGLRIGSGNVGSATMKKVNGLIK